MAEPVPAGAKCESRKCQQGHGATREACNEEVAFRDIAGTSRHHDGEHDANGRKRERSEKQTEQYIAWYTKLR